MAFSYALTGLFALFAAGLSPRILKSLIPAVIGLALLIVLASQTSVYHDASDAFGQRWENATRSEGGDEGVQGVLLNRILNYSLLSGFRTYNELPTFGLGIGMGTNAGAALMTGERRFLISEEHGVPCCSVQFSGSSFFTEWV